MCHIYIVFFFILFTHKIDSFKKVKNVFTILYFSSKLFFLLFFNIFFTIYFQYSHEKDDFCFRNLKTTNSIGPTNFISFFLNIYNIKKRENKI